MELLFNHYFQMTSPTTHFELLDEESPILSQPPSPPSIFELSEDMEPSVPFIYDDACTKNYERHIQLEDEFLKLVHRQIKTVFMTHFQARGAIQMHLEDFETYGGYFTMGHRMIQSGKNCLVIFKLTLENLMNRSHQGEDINLLIKLLNESLTRDYPDGKKDGQDILIQNEEHFWDTIPPTSAYITKSYKDPATGESTPIYVNIRGEGKELYRVKLPIVECLKILEDHPDDYLQEITSRECMPQHTKIPDDCVMTTHFCIFNISENDIREFTSRSEN